MVTLVTVLLVLTSTSVTVLHVTVMQLVTISTAVTRVHATIDTLEMVTNASVLMTMLSGMVTAINATMVTKELDSIAKISTSAQEALTHVTTMLLATTPTAATTALATLDIAVIF